MRVTPDRLAVAAAIRDEYLRQPENREAAGSLKLESVIEAIPELLAAVSDPIKAYARAVAEAVLQEWCGVGELPISDEESATLDAIIATVPAPDVQAQLDAAVAREREECAKVADREDDVEKWGVWASGIANLISQGIRARSAKGV